MESNNIVFITLISFVFTIFVLFYFLNLCKKEKALKIFLIIDIFIVLISNIYNVAFSFLNGNFIIDTFILNYIILFIVLILFNKNQQKLITKDELTGLNNRFALSLFIDNLKEKDKAFLIVGDINKFKNINDNNGHDEGDKVLKIIGSALKNVCYKHSGLFVSRYGGDEFVFIYLSDNENQVKQIILELNKEIKLKCNEIGYDLSMSFGYSKCNKSNFKESFKEADEKMYKVKKGNVI